MKKFCKTFADSAKEFCNLRSVVTAALLVALHTIAAIFLSITVTESLRISISFVVNVVIGCLFGPVMGFVCGGLGDVIQFIFKPTGPYFVGWTISAALAGLIYGCFFYGKVPKTFPKLANKKDNENNKEKHTLIHYLLYLLPFITLILSFVVPFLRVTDKTTGGVISDGTAASLIRQAVFERGSVNAGIIGGIIIALSAVILIMNIWNLHAIPVLLSVFLGFAAILSVYTDKKTMSAYWGFWSIIVLLIIYMLLQVIYLGKKHSIDLGFLARCVIALTLDTILVNILLGTYWVSFMYGKGFMIYFTARLIKNLIQLPINIMITYYILGFIRNIKKSM